MSGISPNGRPYSDIDRELELIPAADLPFNLAGESLNAEHDAREDYHARCVREKAESEARKAQLLIDYDLGIDGVPYGD